MSETRTCPSCSVENPPAARFCNECGARLATAQAIAEERKAVTTFFCGLVYVTVK